MVKAPKGKKGKGKRAPKAEASAPAAAAAAPAAAKEPAAPSKPSVWRPGVDAIDEDETLQYDPTAYDCLHAFTLDWPCLSFDVIADELPGPRSFPHTLYLATGTQAATQRGNVLATLRLSRLTQGQHGSQAKQADSDDESSDSDDEDDAPPVLHSRSVGIPSTVNRVRCAPHDPSKVALWTERGEVQVHDLRGQVAQLTAATDEKPVKGDATRQSPMQAHSSVQEGYALDWSRVAPGQLASGDCAGAIRVWQPREGQGWAVGAPYQGHTGSVEDLQWSPTEATVFASCACDRTLRIWDTRERGRPMLTVAGHDCDVNVIAWNRLAGSMLASGADDGGLRVWDLRSFAPGGHVANFTYHRTPVTAVEWSPQESSVLLTAAQEQVAVWDLALERDPQEEARMAAAMNADLPDEVPAQLLFVHGGQTDVKEAHWHPQIPGLILSTAADGFNIFKPSNVG